LFWLAFVTNRALFIHWDRPTPLDDVLLPHKVDWRPPTWALETMDFHLLVDRPVVTSNLMRSLLNGTAADVVGMSTNLDGVVFLRQLFSRDAPHKPPTAAFLNTVLSSVRERGGRGRALRWSLQTAFDLLFRPSLLLLASLEAELDQVRDAFTTYVWFIA